VLNNHKANVICGSVTCKELACEMLILIEKIIQMCKRVAAMLMKSRLPILYNETSTRIVAFPGAI
jgi:hypothetical protein